MSYVSNGKETVHFYLQYIQYTSPEVLLYITFYLQYIWLMIIKASTPLYSDGKCKP